MTSPWVNFFSSTCPAPAIGCLQAAIPPDAPSGLYVSAVSLKWGSSPVSESRWIKLCVVSAATEAATQCGQGGGSGSGSSIKFLQTYPTGNSVLRDGWEWSAGAASVTYQLQASIQNLTTPPTTPYFKVLQVISRVAADNTAMVTHTSCSDAPNQTACLPSVTNPGTWSFSGPTGFDKLRIDMSFLGSLTAVASSVSSMGNIQSVEYEVDLEVHSNSTLTSPVPNTRWKVTFRLSRNGSGSQKIMHMKRPSDTGTGGNHQMMNPLNDSNPVRLVPVLLEPATSAVDASTRLRYRLAGVKRQFVSGQPEAETFHAESLVDVAIDEAGQSLGGVVPQVMFTQSLFPEFYTVFQGTATPRNVLQFTSRNCQNSSCGAGAGETGPQPLIVFTSPQDLSGLASPTAVTAGAPLKLRYTLFVRGYPVDASGNLITPAEPMAEMQLKLDLPLPP